MGLIGEKLEEKLSGLPRSIEIARDRSDGSVVVGGGGVGAAHEARAPHEGDEEEEGEEWEREEKRPH